MKRDRLLSVQAEFSVKTESFLFYPANLRKAVYFVQRAWRTLVLIGLTLTSFSFNNLSQKTTLYCEKHLIKRQWLKSGSDLPKNVFLFALMKFLLKVFLIIQENGLIWKRRLISKFMTSQTGKQIIAIHKFSNLF